MVIGTGISLWRCLVQSQVDSQTHAERRITYLFIPTLPHIALSLHYLSTIGVSGRCAC